MRAAGIQKLANEAERWMTKKKFLYAAIYVLYTPTICHCQSLSYKTVTKMFQIIICIPIIQIFFRHV